MTRILVVDDHPAVRAGLLVVLRGEPGLVPVGTAGTAEQALEAACRWKPDVVLADYQLPDRDGALLTWELKQLPEPPHVVIYSAFAEPRLSLAAALSGAEAVLDKNRSVDAVFETIRGVAAGKSYLEPVPLEAVRDEHSSSNRRTSRSSGWRSRANKRPKSPQSCGSTRTPCAAG